MTTVAGVKLTKITDLIMAKVQLLPAPKFFRRATPLGAGSNQLERVHDLRNAGKRYLPASFENIGPSAMLRIIKRLCPHGIIKKV